MATQLQLRWAGWLTLALLSVLSGLLISYLPTHTEWFTQPGVAALVALVASLFPIARRILSGTLDVFEPVLWACAMLASLFGVRPLIMLSTGDRTFQHAFDIHAGFNRAVLLGMLGTVSFVLGYETLIAAKVPVVLRRLPSNLVRPAARPVVMWLATIGGLLFLLRLSVAGNPITTLQVLAQGRSFASADANISAYLDDGPLLLASAATIAILSASETHMRRSQGLTVASLVLGSLLAFYLLGNRRLIIPSVMTPVITYYFVRAKRPKWRMLVLVVPVAFVVLATIPLERSLGARQNEGGAVAIFAKAFEAPFEPVTNFFTGVDTAMVPALGLEVEALGKPADYYFGRATVGDLLLSPLPSAVIPGKPQTARNDLLIRIFGSPCTAVSGNLCPDFSAVGTFYQDFWFFGAVGGMLLLGIFSAALWRRFKEVPRDPVSLILASSWAVSLPIIIRAGFMPAFQWWLEFILPTWLAIHFIQHPGRRLLRRDLGYNHVRTSSQ